MTPENTMKPDVLAEHERQAAEAFERIQSGQHWTDCAPARGLLEAGRQRAMRESYSNQPAGSAYNKAFGRWMTAQGWPRKLDNPTRNHLLWVADHLAEIEGWRETLATNQRMSWNHPTTIKRRYERAMQARVAEEKGEVVQSPQAQMKALLIEAQEDADKWRRRAEEGGSMFDLQRDTPKDIGRIVVGRCSPTKAKAIADAIRAELKLQTQAHAG